MIAYYRITNKVKRESVLAVGKDAMVIFSHYKKFIGKEVLWLIWYAIARDYIFEKYWNVSCIDKMNVEPIGITMLREKEAKRISTPRKAKKSSTKEIVS